MTDIAQGGSTIAIVHLGNGAPAILNLKTGQVRFIQAGNTPQGSVFTPDSKRLYLTVRESNTIPTSPGPAFEIP